MPAVSKSQDRLMRAAAHTEGGYGGVSQEAARKFLEHGDDSELPPYMRKVTSDAAAPQSAAGIIHIAPDGDILLLHRAKDEKNYGGHWSLPGGGVNDGEEPEFGARREAVEEMGTDAPDGRRRLLDRVTTPTGMAFHTFVQPVTNKFAPKLNGEHSGYTWTSPANLPQPLHPSVEKTIRERIGVAADMKPEDWEGLRDGFLAWLAEEQDEAEHLENAHDNQNQDFKVRVLAQDSLPLAFDRDSVREIDGDGRMHISKANICKACVSPYFGYEIPDWEQLGLERDRKYHLLRDPDELQRAIPSANRLPLLRKHLPTSADDHPHWETVGTVGSTANWEDPYVTNDLAIWVGDDVEGVVSKKKRELSPGYKYRADMTPGNFNGIRFDGVMRDIAFNHVALVEDGRQGPDIVVGDSAEELMSKAILATAVRAQTIGALVAYFKPRMAMDAKFEIAPLLKGVTGKKLSTDMLDFAAKLKSSFKGKLAQDANADGLGMLLDALGKNEESHDEVVPPETMASLESSAAALPMATMPPPANDDDPSAKVSEFLKGKGMGEDDIKTVCDMLPKAPPANAVDEKDDEDDDEKKKFPAAEDEDDDDEKKEKPLDKQAMDAAIDTAVKSARKQERDRSAAFDIVRPWVGEIAPQTAMALDSKPAVIRHALKMLNVEGADDLHETALEAVLRVQPKAGAKPTNENGGMALDAAATKDLQTRFPHLQRIRAA